MLKYLGMALVACLFAVSVRAEEEKKEEKKDAKPVVIIETSMGNIEVELDREKAPVTVANFLGYVKDKFYDGTVFHRVMGNFMIQGGGFGPDLKEKKTKDPIKNEATNGLTNAVGTIAMARMQGKDTAASEFFINVVDNAQSLDHKNKSDVGYGYAVFGHVVSGMDVVNKIKDVKTGKKTGEIQGQNVELDDVPVETVTIKSIREK
jgi:cyclophilin family peptidyl-prolyl cis-trans isomerase